MPEEIIKKKRKKAGLPIYLDFIIEGSAPPVIEYGNMFYSNPTYVRTSPTNSNAQIYRYTNTIVLQSTSPPTSPSGLRPGWVKIYT